MWIYLLQGIGFGFAAASQPGPLQTYLITQSITRGWRSALPTALAPLVSDGPIIVLCVLVLSQVPDWMQRFLYLAGGIFVLYLTYGTYKAWREFHEYQAQSEIPNRQNILKAAMTEVTLDTTKKYDPKGLLVQSLRLVEKDGHVLWETTLSDLQNQAKSPETKK